MQGEHLARIDTNGAGWQLQRDRLKSCIRDCDRIAALCAGIMIGLLVAWGA